jgi:TonB-linked SusC/RagA family outer membrane protein
MKKFLLLLIYITIAVSASSQIQIKGVVYDENNETLPGTTVMEENTQNGVVTDIDGVFIINVSSETSVLLFSSIGFETQKVELKGRNLQLKVYMKESVSILDEVVVVGYGQQKKASVIGAISDIRNDQIKIAAPANLTNAIAGRITGAIVRLGDGNIGGGNTRYSEDGTLNDAQIFIRGMATTNSAAPLILVDGIESSFANINPEDIEQMSVLKDASATAVYGVRGANGVILITTKRGQIGKPKIFVKSEIRMHEPLNFPTFLGAYDYAYLYNEASRNMGLRERYTQYDLERWKLGDDPYGHPDVDWRNLLVEDYFTENQTSINLTGGSEKIKY